MSVDTLSGLPIFISMFVKCGCERSKDDYPKPAAVLIFDEEIQPPLETPRRPTNRHVLIKQIIWAKIDEHSGQTPTNNLRESNTEYMLLKLRIFRLSSQTFWLCNVDE